MGHLEAGKRHPSDTIVTRLAGNAMRGRSVCLFRIFPFPPLSAHKSGQQGLVRCVVSVVESRGTAYFALPLIFTLIGFFCLGSSLVISIPSLVDPFFTGE